MLLPGQDKGGFMVHPQDIELMKQRAGAVQTVVAEVKSMQRALEYAVEVTGKQGGVSIAAPALGRHTAALKALCGKNGLTLFTENLRERIGSMSTALTMAEWGIAETATLVVDSASEDLRIATMLSETHVAVLRRSRIVPDANALEEELKRKFAAGPGYLAFISGASRTADIERVLAIGVHGPQELHVLILGEDRS